MVPKRTFDISASDASKNEIKRKAKKQKKKKKKKKN